MASFESSLAAAKYKEEGNALFMEKNYEAAYQKYSKAIEADGNNAILYANRAACCHNLQRYLDAATDAQRAVEIDPTYAKGWSRLAGSQAALGMDDASAKSWRSALDTLPIENLTPAQLKQKQQYESELKAIERKVQKAKGALPKEGFQLAKDDVPWMRARQIAPELETMGEDGKKSSAWVIHGAFMDWTEGLEMMKMQHLVPHPNGGQALMGRTGAISAFSNAILRDARVFHLDGPDFLDQYMKQGRIEVDSSGAIAWSKSGPEEIKAQALERYHTEGWGSSLRQAMGLTVRLWIMRGYMDQMIRRRYDVSVEFIGRALEFLKWGAETWKDSSTSDRGIVFSPSFIVGVHALYLDAYLNATQSDPKRFSMETLYKDAQDLLKECEDVVLPDESLGDPGFKMSFTTYPKGRALSTIAFYHAKIAERLLAGQNAKAELEKILQHSRSSAEHYMQSAFEYPVDEEMHVWFLVCAVQNFWRAGAPLHVTLPLLELIRANLPRMRKIWEHSPLTRDNKHTYEYMLKMEDEFRKAIAEGKVTDEAQVSPDQFAPPFSEDYE